MTRWYMKMFCRVSVTDTQTGLRGIGVGVMPLLMNAPGERFEYETNMLLQTRIDSIPIVEVPISTIYIDNNSGSHFHPILDSLKIYRQLAKFSISSGASFGVDIALFWLCNRFLPIAPLSKRILWATVVSRGCSSIVNFTLNKKMVFSQNRDTANSLVKYYALCLLQGAASFALVALAAELTGDRYVVTSKILIDFALFMLSFRLQKRWVFAKRQKTSV